MKSGFVTIVGRPNTGKSTLLNSILERKIAITSNVSGTTRNIIEGIYNDDDSQIVFVDTPGIHKPVNKLGTYMNNKAYEMIGNVDVILFLIDVTKPFGKGDNLILEKLKNENKPTFLILNKVDLINKDNLLKIIKDYSSLYDFAEIYPVSAKNGDNVDDLISSVKKYLPDGDRYYSEDEITNVSRNFQIAELVREKLLWLTRDEIPHTITCYTETYEDMGDYIDIGVVIVVDRENLKKIIIGKGGSLLKRVGIESRGDIEELLNKHVNLNTYVKVIESWREKEKFLKELGFDEINE
jgi:GTP-binding protein Era